MTREQEGYGGIGEVLPGVTIAELRQTAINAGAITPEQRQVFPALPEQPAALTEAMDRYREAWDNNALTPELVDETWRTFWQTTLEIEPNNIPSCDRTTEELAELKEQNRGVVLLPDEVMNVAGMKR